MTRPCAYGPRSLMRTTTDWPVRSLVTRSLVPNGRVLCAAVSAWVLNRSPFAVRFPWKPRPYQEAAPLWSGLGSWPDAELAPRAQLRRAAVMARAVEGFVMRLDLLLLHCT